MGEKDKDKERIKRGKEMIEQRVKGGKGLGKEREGMNVGEDRTGE